MLYETSIRPDFNTESEQIRKILIVLARANSPAPLGYISFYTGIKEPLEVLRKMEERGLICRVPSSTWSCCMDPMYEVTSATREKYFHTLESMGKNLRDSYNPT